MISDANIREQLANVLTATNYSFLGERYQGKVRDCYVVDDLRYLITTDRLSCFDVVVSCIPFKGQVLNQLAVHWFEYAKDIVPIHLVDMPDPNVMVVKNCEIFPVEVVIRGYLTGSAWRDYEAGKDISGVRLPEGLRPSEKLPEIILTPSTKAEKGLHDEPISEEEILDQGLVEKKLWEQVREVSFNLFELGCKKADEQGLILVDTKYEFGLIDGKLILADEIHTLDSSRYWIKSTYPGLFESGDSPEMLDKEPTRQWLLSQGYKGQGEIPEFTDEHRINISRRYVDSYEKVSGLEFNGEVGSVVERIESNLKNLIK